MCIRDSPYISKSTAEYLKNLGVKAVGVDMLNVDKTCIQGEQYTENSTASHNIFLDNDILIVENLTNLEKMCIRDRYYFLLDI